MDAQLKVNDQIFSFILIDSIFMYFMYIYIGVLFYQDSDLYHATFWSKSNKEVLCSFSDSWRYDFVHCT